MSRRPPSATRTDTLLPDTTLCRSGHRGRPGDGRDLRARGPGGDGGGCARRRARVRRLRRQCRDAPEIYSPGGCGLVAPARRIAGRSEEHTSELQSLMRTSYAVFCLKKKTLTDTQETHTYNSN